MAVPVDQSDDESLRQLLAIESRLQGIVRAAKQEASRRIAEATAAAEQRRAAAHQAAEARDAEQARADRVAHEQALEAIAAAHRQVLEAIDRTPDSRIDDLADWALVQAMGGREAS